MDELSITRRVRLQDLRNSRVLRTYFHTSDPQEFPGTSPLITSVMINELRATGHTRVTYLDVEPQFGMTFVKHTVSGDLIRVGPGPVELTMLVNGNRIALRTLHVKARVVDGDYVREFEQFLLDDAANPMVLKSLGARSSGQVVKIEFPLPPGAADSMEQELSKKRKAVIYGIYFAFARADIRPASERVLKEIAQVMKKNPDWKLRIDGHTDSIGGDKSNLELSQRRAASVKSALVQRFGIAADRLSSGGYGASQPQEKNDTPESRARNRRVVLTRE
jgi:outer membrane protein OmpA-like peptidoglycan-associated protein